MREVTLASGNVLQVNAAPFADAKALYQTVLRELTVLRINGENAKEVFKNALCLGFSSPEIEAALAKCMARCTYATLKIDGQTFEPVERRGDYMKVCVEVARENIDPFLTSLFAEFEHAISMTESILKSKLATTNS